jgi:fibro-slime domain-containing protein
MAFFIPYFIHIISTKSFTNEFGCGRLLSEINEFVFIIKRSQIIINSDKNRKSHLVRGLLKVSLNIMKNILSKFFSGFTIFMMIMSFAGPVNVSAQVEDPITPALEVIETPSDEVIDTTTEEEIVEETPGTDTEPTAPEEEGEKKEEVSELSRTAIVVIDEPQTATISATKILCPSEDLLPNWGNYGADITSTSASNFLAQNPECEQVDWNFEWSIGAAYVDDNILTGGDDWTSFENGTTVVPAGQNIGLREQMLPGYTTFTGQNTNQDISAEFYCGSDVLNYDNLEYVNTVAGETYHCVAFNAHPDMCSNLEGIQVEIPKGMETDGDYCYTPEEPQEGMCEEGDETYEVVYVSDSGTLVDENPSAVLSFIHDAWTAVIPGASWIWSTDPVTLVASVDEVETFTKTFEVTGTPTSASLMVAADNSYSVTLNGVTPLTCDGSGILNFQTADTCIIDVTDLNTGENTLLFTVTNKEIADNLNPKINPAGLIYKLEINGDCEVCEMEQGWDVDYYNYTHADTGMNLPQSAWYKKSTYGNPLSADNTFVTTDDTWTGWSYGMDKYEFSQVESDLMFGSQNFFPFDSGAGLPHKNESLSWSYDPNTLSYTMFDNTPGGKDYHFGLHATGYVTAPSTGDYGFTLTADDDVWIYVNGNLVVDNSGVHGIPGPVTGDDEFIPLNAGVNKVELFYAERHVTQAGLNFSFTDDLKITTTEDCLPPPPVDMCPNIDGVQETVPEGMEKNNDGQCVRTEEPLVCEAGVNLVQNGGFENPVLDSGTWGLFPEGDLLGWMIDWIYGSEGTPTLEIQNNVAGASYEGNQHAELDGNHPVGMYQVIETIPGETYDFSYAYSARPGRDAEDNKIWVEVQNYAGATVYGVADHSVDATETSDTVWTTYSGSFVADSKATIMFNDMGTDTSFGGYIDAVSLTCNPEPEVDMCEWNNDIPADSEDCVPPTPTVGNIVIDKYICPADTTILRSENGIDGFVPEGCVPQSGATFGIVHGEQTDANGPYPELDAVTMDDLEVSNGSGQATFAEVSTSGRYLVVETDAEGNKLPHDAILGLFCEGDGDNSDNNDNQELTFVDGGENSNCVAYNKMPIDDTDPVCEDGYVLNEQEQCVPEDDGGNEGDGEPTPNRSTSGSRSNRSGGSVLGATSDACEWSIDTYMRNGYKNDTAQVKVMQMLMNKYVGSTLTIDGMFGNMTEAAVKAFQTKYADEILKGAWGITSPTGIFFRSTLAKAKNLECPEVVTPIPVGLTNAYNWSKAKNEIVPAQ